MDMEKWFILYCCMLLSICGLTLTIILVRLLIGIF